MCVMMCIHHLHAVQNLNLNTNVSGKYNDGTFGGDNNFSNDAEMYEETDEEVLGVIIHVVNNSTPLW